MYKTFVFLLATLSLAGCAATNAANQARRTAFESTIPTCTGDVDCKAKWEAAQLWVVKNSGYKLQIVTDVLLETYNATDYSTNLAVRVTKEPVGSGTYRLIVSTNCANIFGCTPNAWDAAIDFNRKISAVKP